MGRLPIASDDQPQPATVRPSSAPDDPPPSAERLLRGLEANAAIITAGLEGSGRSDAIHRMVGAVRERLGWEALAVLLVEDGELRVSAQYGFPADVADRSYALDAGILGRVAVTGEPYLAADTDHDPWYVDAVPGTRSELCVPLLHDGQVRGVINAESSVPGAFDVHDLALLGRLADQMSLVLHHTELLAGEREAAVRASELERLRTRLLTLTSHELRTPLTVVIGFAEVLAEHAEQLPPDRVAEYAGSIIRHASALARLVDHMLVAAQAEAGRLTVDVRPVDLEHLVGEAVQGHGRDIDVLPGVSGRRVLADPFRLRQVLQALFDNAVAYAGDRGRIQIDARTVGGEVQVLLRDEGPGIPPEEQRLVFEPFHQVGEDRGVAGRRGMGLGLAVARDLVELMDGRLELASAEGYGATFLLSLRQAR